MCSLLLWVPGLYGNIWDGKWSEVERWDTSQTALGSCGQWEGSEKCSRIDSQWVSPESHIQPDGQQVALCFPFCLPWLLGREPNIGRAELKIVNNRFRIG